MQTWYTHPILCFEMQAKSAGVMLALRTCGPVTLTKDEAKTWFQQKINIVHKTSPIFAARVARSPPRLMVPMQRA